MRKRPLLKYALAVTMLLPAAGCVSSSTGGLAVAFKEGGGMVEIRIDDTFFRQHVEVVECIGSRTELGYLRASALVRNRYGKDFPIQYKFTWFGADGVEVQEGGRPWEQKVLHGGEDVSLKATAPEKSAVKFVVRMRRMK